MSTKAKYPPTTGKKQLVLLCTCALVLFFRTKDFVRRIHLFMQNEPNFKKVKFNVSNEMKKNYEQMDTWSSGKNKANSNPIKANLLNDQMNINKVLTRGSEKKLNWAISENKPNFSPKQTRTNPISNYPCVFELAVYNLVLRDSNLANFYGE